MVLRRAAPLVVLALTMTAALAQPRQPAAPAVLAATGGYELSNADGTRKCLLLLRPASVPGGHGVGFPAPCRMAFPILASVTAWTVEPVAQAPRLRLRLLNGAGAVLVDFRDGADDAAQGRDAAEAIYLLRPTAGQSLAQRADALAARPAAVVPVPRAALVEAAAADPAAMRKATGPYHLMRTGARDTGCRVELTGGADREGAVTLAPGCADKGVQVFGAKAWTISGGTLWLTGAKGRLSFERNRKGGWDKGPGQGEALTLTPAMP